MGNRKTDTQKGKDKVQVEPRPKVEREKWQRINWGIIEEVYVTRNDIPSYRDLADEFKVNFRNLSLVAEERKWVVKRRIYQDKITAKTQQKLSSRMAEVRARNIAMVESGLGYLGELMKNRQLKGSVSDIDKLTRALEFLLGNADSRPDGGGSFEDFIRKLNADRRKAYRDATGGNKVIDAPVTEVKQDDISKRPDKPDNG